MSYILIVDDDHNMAQTLSDMVGLFDWNTQIVTSPRAAIESLNRNPPALLLLDLNMPGVDGMEVCRYIKRDPITGSTPVVFVTAEDDPGTQAKAREAGAMDYLVKPVDIDKLEQVLNKLPTKPGEKTTAEKALAATKSGAGTAPVTPPVVQSVPPAAPSHPTPPTTPAAQPASPSTQPPAQTTPPPSPSTQPPAQAAPQPAPPNVQPSVQPSTQPTPQQGSTPEKKS